MSDIPVNTPRWNPESKCMEVWARTYWAPVPTYGDGEMAAAYYEPRIATLEATAAGLRDALRKIARDLGPLGDIARKALESSHEPH